jgi:microsomal dipeptidase-like Zn-dependent dipeptidase
MNRREFLKYCSLLGASVALGKTSAYANWLTNEKRNCFPQGMLLIDAHAHPDQFYYMGPTEGPQWEAWCAQFCDDSSTLEKILTVGVQNSSFAAIGDTQTRALIMDEVMPQIQKVIGLEQQGLVRIVRRHENIVHGGPPKGFIPGAILSLEGASPLGSDESTVLGNLNILYEHGVRMITLMHYRANDIGCVMTELPFDGGGLTVLGQQMVERVTSLGIIVDVAHAHINTLQGVAEVARINGVPIIDSHTSLTHRENPYGTTRLRTFEEMEMVAETGGVVCTWPLGWYVDENHHRMSFLDWAEENLEIAREIGIEHVGLGTDGGGVLPEMVEGYASILDLPKLVEAMDEVGFKRSEIAAYMGGNLFRVIKQCIG